MCKEDEKLLEEKLEKSGIQKDQQYQKATERKALVVTSEIGHPQLNRQLLLFVQLGNNTHTHIYLYR